MKKFTISEEKARKILNKGKSDKITRQEIIDLENHVLELARFLYDMYQKQKIKNNILK